MIFCIKAVLWFLLDNVVVRVLYRSLQHQSSMRTLEESILLQLLPEHLKEQCIIFLTRGAWRNI